MLLVDDVMFLHPLGELFEKECVSILNRKDENLSAFAIHLRLNSRIDKSQTRSQYVTVPNLTMQCSDHDPKFLLFDRADCSVEWGMPFDLSCSIYRKTDLQLIFESVNDLSHPNLIEVNVNKWLKIPQGSSLMENRLFACPDRPIAVILTVNRVQNIFLNPICESKNQQQLEVYSLNQSLLCFESCPPLLFCKFCLSSVYSASIHICFPPPVSSCAQSSVISLPPYFYRKSVSLPSHFCSNLSSLCLDQNVTINGTLVSWLVPVYNGCEWIHQSYRSMKNQIGIDTQLVEIIFVDDCSTDESFTLLNKIASEDPSVTITQTLYNSGVANTLNLGLSLCKGKFIARLDIDDVALPYRLLHQIRYLVMNPEISVLGSAFTISEESNIKGFKKVFIMPNHSDIVK
eukprot:GHVL01028445.1.p1 GENE.GHVL01028445.1~~GHVL01028445.1.p1  ORF type:complete len:402 (-),score=49.22 GHVL01028445.1:672-1877(-)